MPVSPRRAPATYLDVRDYGTLTLGLSSANPTAALVTQNTTTMQAGIDASATLQLPLVLPAGLIRVNTLRAPGGINMRGAGWSTGRDLATTVMANGSGAALLWDTATYGAMYGGHIREIFFAGDSGPAVSKTGPEQAPTYVYFEDCKFITYATDQSAVYVSGPLSEWFFTRCVLTGAKAGFECYKPVEMAGTIDGMNFHDVQFGGKHFVYAVSHLGNDWVFDHAFGNTAGEGHAFYFNGAINGYFTRCYANEQMFITTLPRLVTTATATSGSAVVVLASTTGLSVGDQLTVVNAGASGGLLEANVTDITGSNVTLDATAGTSGTGLYATRARYDIVHAEGNVSFTFYDTKFFQGSGCNVRFGMYGAGGSTFYGSVVSPVWDFYGEASIIESALTQYVSNSNYVTQASGTRLATTDNSSVLPSGNGQDFHITLQPGGDNYTAPWGSFKVHKRGSGGGERARIDADGNLRLAGRIGGPLSGSIPAFTSGDTSPSVSAGNVFKTANTGATSITTFDDGETGQVIRVICKDSNTTVVNGSTIKTSTGADKTLTSNRVYRFVLDGSVWYEDA